MSVRTAAESGTMAGIRRKPTKGVLMAPTESVEKAVYKKAALALSRGESIFMAIFCFVYSCKPVPILQTDLAPVLLH
jgi:hypothetical protein